jgi:hypothetical protein
MYGISIDNRHKTVLPHFFFILIPWIINYVDIKQPNALKLYISLFFSQWLLHVSVKQCHPQGVTIFLSEPLPRQYGTRQILGHMTEPTHQRAI